MALGPRLDLRQSQSLVMTPQLQQAIKLLQMTNIELQAFIVQEIESNPLLEREDVEGGLETGVAENGDGEPAGDSSGEDSAAAQDSYSDDEPHTPDSAEMTNSETLLESDSAALDTDYENVWDTQPTPGTQERGDEGVNWMQQSAGGGEDAPDLENLASQHTTLRDHLLSQVNVDFEDPADRLIASMLIEGLDDAGYYTGDTEQVADAMGCDVERVEETLDQVQRFDPTGIFATSLSECLGLQLRDRNRLDEPMQTLLENLDLLGRHDITTLRKMCGVTPDELTAMIQEIRTLNPKPASEFDHNVAQPVIPDVLVHRDKDGGWVVELNNETLPRVLVNSRYYAVVKKQARKKDEQEYLIDCFQSASWLVKSLQQRAQTILKVATELVRQQNDFFSKGVQHLRPLTLREIAEVVGVHESTVSRVTNNKFLGMSRGVFEMKYFFSSGVGQNLVGDSHSAESIRFRIQTLVNDETPDSVLSDDKIVDILRADGIDIARRTVAKYRDALRIPSSVQRRRAKAIHA